jgi:hypothetical protein
MQMMQLPLTAQSGPNRYRQTVTTIIWQLKKPQKTPNNEMKTPKLSKKMKHLQPCFESQSFELQWTMYNKSKKSMLGFQEGIRWKTNSLIHHNNATYHHKHNINRETRPTEKNHLLKALWGSNHSS